MAEGENGLLRWQTRPLAEVADSRPEDLSEGQLKMLEELREQAKSEGHAAGKEEALLSHAAEMEQKLAQFDTLLNGLSKPYEELNNQVVEELVGLAGQIARQLVSRELRSTPDTIMGIVREAIAVLPEDRSEIKVHLNDQDAELVRELSRLADHDKNWEVMEDPTLQRGDCRVTMGASRVDAGLEARTNAIIARLLGGEREEDHS